VRDRGRKGARNISDALFKKVPSPFMEKGFRDEVALNATHAL